MTGRVVVVDDSTLMRWALRSTLVGAGFRVVGEAGGGREAIELVKRERPDLVTMDLDMPDMDGLDAIERVMAECPTPILVVTAIPRYRGLDAHFEALARGAVELVPKPSAFPGTPREQRDLIATANLAMRIPVVAHVRASVRRRRRTGEMPSPTGIRLVVIGASTGGPGVLRALLTQLPRLDAPVLIVQHMVDVFAQGFVDWLAAYSGMPVCEATPGMRLEAGTVYIAVRGPNLRIRPDGRLEAAPDQRSSHRPSVDVVFASAAESFGKSALGVLLTGMGEDGAAGLLAIHAAGGLTVAQDEATSTVYGMPRAAVERGAARLVLPDHELARAIQSAVANGG
jgi:two-component system chemotaxis response regulator CheB